MIGMDVGSSLNHPNIVGAHDVQMHVEALVALCHSVVAGAPDERHVERAIPLDERVVVRVDVALGERGHLSAQGLQFVSELAMAPFGDHAIGSIGLERFTKAENLANIHDSQTKDKAPATRSDADQSLNREPFDRVKHRGPAYAQFGRHPVNRDLLAGLEFAPQNAPADGFVGLLREIRVVDALEACVRPSEAEG